MRRTKKYIIMALCAAFAAMTTQAQRPTFDANKDLLILAYDISPDPDDLHAAAAAGSLLSHSQWYGKINYYAVMGAYGNQANASSEFINSPDLFTLAFGAKNTKWTDAHADFNGSVTRLKNKAIPIINGGGKVWIAEGGQSKVSAAFLRQVASSVGVNTMKANVVLVQHDDGFNEKWTPTADLNYVKANTQYFLLDDGNAPWNAAWGDHGPWQTPEYRSKTNYMTPAKTSSNTHAKNLWTEADRLFKQKWPNGFPHTWSFFNTPNAVDFSDTVEVWWILQDTSIDSVDKFWNKYVKGPANGTPPGGGNPPPAGQGLGDTVLGASYNAESHPSDQNNIRKIGNDVAYIKGGNWIRFDNFDFGSGAGSVEVSACSPAANGGKIEFRLGSATGTLIASVDVVSTGWSDWKTFTANVSGASGTKNLYVKFVDSKNINTYLMNLRSFKFTAGSAPPPPPPPAGQAPYGGSARSITSLIQAEHYDTGGENVAYHDTSTGNAGGQVRTDNVDVGISGGRTVVGWTSGGEWLEYTVNASSGTYDIEMWAAAPSAGKRIVVKLDNTTLGTLTLPSTGGWHTYGSAPHKLTGVNVSGGNGKILRVEFPDGGLNLDNIKFVAQSAPPPPPPPPSGSDTVSTAQLDASIPTGTSFQLSIPYTTQQNRDIHVELRPASGGASLTYKKFDANSRSGTANVTMTTGTAPAAGSYIWKIYMTTDNGGWQNPVGGNDGKADFNVTLTSGGNPPPPPPPTTLSGLYHLKSAASANHLYGYDTATAARVAPLATWPGFDWTLENVSGNVYRLKGKWAGLYLTGSSGGGGNTTTAALISSSDTQKWTLELVSGTTYQLKCNASGQYLSADTGNWSATSTKPKSTAAGLKWELDKQ